MLPPRWVRRLVLAPGVVALCGLMLATVPVWVLGGLVLSPLVPGRWRLLRVGWIALLHLMLEAGLLVVLFGLWVASGFGYALRSPRFQRAHYALLRFYLGVMFGEAERVLRVRVTVEGPGPEVYRDRPLLVFCRHAGPGDSFLLTDALVNRYEREPRIVLKDTLQWDPLVDVALNRLPSTFVGSGGRRRGDLEAEIGALARDLDGDDAFVIFPEGGNFTDLRRARSIERLREKGLLAEAEMAERLRHVLAPRPGGVVAALANARGADVVWVAHTGTDTLHSVADVWRALPMDRTVLMRWWRVPHDEVPTGRDEQVAWLYEWWARIDAWIAENRDRA